MQAYRFVLYYLWIAPHLILAAVAWVMYARRLHKSFPVFFVYSLYETLEFLLLLSIAIASPRGGTMYQYAFVATLAGSKALRFGIIQEIFNNVFRDYPRLERSATVSLRWLTGLLVVAALLLALKSSGTVPDNLMTGIALLGRSVAVIQAGLLVFLFLFSRWFGLSWRSWMFGIALGFGLLASTELAVSALHLNDLSASAARLLNLLPTGSYHVSVLIWLAYLLMAERPVAAVARPVPEIEQWSGILGRSPQ